MLFEHAHTSKKSSSDEVLFSDKNGGNLEPFKPRMVRLGEKEARISNLLRDFSPKGVEEEAMEILADAPEMDPLLSVPIDAISFSQREMEEAKLAAFAAGVEQGKRERQAEMEAQFDADRILWEERLAQEIDTVKRETIEDIARNLDATLQEGLQGIKQQIEHDLAQAMMDIVGTDLTKQALDDFVAKITHEAIAAHAPLIIEGRQELLDVFAAKTQLAQGSYRLQPTSSDEIRLVLANEVISTRLAPLMQELRALF